MKKIYQIPLVIIFLTVCALHTYLFVSGITLSADVNTFESTTKKLRLQNKELEKKLYTVESLTNAASQAAALKYDVKAVPVYVNNLGIALNR